MILAVGGKMAGLLAVSDPIKASSLEALIFSDRLIFE
jgi:cation transport ATPase